MVTKEGIITSTFENKVWVKTVRSKTCESCESHDSCETASKAQEMTIQLENSLNASIGDRVIVGFRTAPLLKVTFLLYIFPHHPVDCRGGSRGRVGGKIAYRSIHHLPDCWAHLFFHCIYCHQNH